LENTMSKPITVVGLLPAQEHAVSRALPGLKLRFLPAASAGRAFTGTAVLVTKFIGHRVEMRAHAAGARVVRHRGGVKTLVALLPLVAAG
jgi:hypothetical protein